jgi:hypothetical protein
MRKPVGCFSIYGLIGALVVLVGVGALTWLKGATLFSPGPLTAINRGTAPLQGYASHAEMESQCTLCHSPWQGVDPARCQACHSTVERQIAARTGLHGWLEDPQACTLCHPDHQGRTANIGRAALAYFPHDRVGFSLARHQRSAEGAAFACTGCHGAGYSLNQGTCAACHQQMDGQFMARHVDLYGDGCLSCHDGTALPEGFDHAAVLPLEGAHAEIACTACHGATSRALPPAVCVACHQEPAIHRGQFGTDCAACHTAQAWQPAALRYHAFPLDHGQQGDVACSVCHLSDYVSYTCYGCHEHQPADVASLHREEGIADWTECVLCHPTGRQE